MGLSEDHHQSAEAATTASSQSGKTSDPNQNLPKPEPESEASLYTEPVIRFKVHDKVFPIHRELLATKLPGFAEKILNDKSNEQLEQISDIDVEVFQKLVQFIYQDKVTGLEPVAGRLWVVADKYQIEPLKRLCEHQMCPELTTESVIDTLLLADANHAAKLRTPCIEYLNAHAHQVWTQHPAKWNDFIARAHPTLISDLYCDLVQKYHKASRSAQEEDSRLDKICRMSVWSLAGAACIALILFLCYVVYIGATDSKVCLVLVLIMLLATRF